MITQQNLNEGLMGYSDEDLEDVNKGEGNLE